MENRIACFTFIWRIPVFCMQIEVERLPLAGDAIRMVVMTNLRDLDGTI